jgi:hypothetical protein
VIIEEDEDSSQDEGEEESKHTPNFGPSEGSNLRNLDSSDDESDLEDAFMDTYDLMKKKNSKEAGGEST